MISSITLHYIKLLLRQLILKTYIFFFLSKIFSFFLSNFVSFYILKIIYFFFLSNIFLFYIQECLLVSIIIMKSTPVYLIYLKSFLNKNLMRLITAVTKIIPRYPITPRTAIIILIFPLMNIHHLQILISVISFMKIQMLRYNFILIYKIKMKP